MEGGWQIVGTTLGGEQAWTWSASGPVVAGVRRSRSGVADTEANARIAAQDAHRQLNQGET